MRELKNWRCEFLYGPPNNADLPCILFDFERVKATIWNKIILHRVHALVRDPQRGGRDHFTARQIDKIRSRCDKFGDFFAKIVPFEGFSSFVFILYSKFVETFNFFRSWVDYVHFHILFFNFIKVQNPQFWAKITGSAHVVDPGIEHEPRRFFDAFWRKEKPEKFQDLRFRSKTSHF